MRFPLPTRHLARHTAALLVATVSLAKFLMRGEVIE